MSARVLNDAQFAAMVNEDGASRHLQSMVQGPGRGYYVSLPASAGTARTLRGRDASAVDVSFHRNRSRQAIKSTPWASQRELYQGGWNSGSKVDLDVSERVSDIGTALRKGYAHEQEAVYDANRGADLHTDLHPALARGPKVPPLFNERRPGRTGTYRIQRDHNPKNKRGWSYA
jgi:hypothetical protein